ncbi:uncharacterized protein LOC103381892 isoform X1 [Cynoglossus semilaevis]|uniref:uncharacterized protein LOC103381892 isoform X1 n=2 Tax=Cynoglossus semilaevis TaxID=244447 RepID=UPI000D62EDE6|nr:uncharacterized protein LOC103381892 isoform X1 [Cynoglossus semilaevis]XP_024911746.1 uncharacterized protein LOC103381892 isoform X1 [Cynoglossus semilaevis]
MAPRGTPSRNMSQLFFSSDLFILIPVGQTLLSAMTLRLNDTVKQIGHLFTQSEETVEKLDSLSERTATAHTQSEELQVRLRATEATVNSLTEKSEELWWRQNATEQQVKINTEDAFVKMSHSHAQLQEQLLTQNSGETSSSSSFQIELLDQILIKMGHFLFTVLGKRLQNSESLMMSSLQLHVSDLSFRLNESEHRLQQLLNHSSGDLKVAFSAALTDSGSVGPFDQETTLIFSKVFSAVGGAYNPTEGVFTAPVRGIYFFSFTAADFLKGYMGLYLYKNNQPIIFNLNLNDHGGYASTSSNMALQLEEGDRVHLTLPASYRLYDDSRNFSIFSGFLLFTL